MACAVLCADDYAISDGVSRGIRELAAAGRLSATSAIVTLPRWPEDAALIEPLRERLSIGLHLNLTLGAPLGPMPRLAPAGRFPSVGALIGRALAGRLDRGEIEAEISRQITAFTAALGHPPDHVDGHQHVHALPGIRGPLLAALAHLLHSPAMLVRDPGDRLQRIIARGLEPAKAATVALLSRGFGGLARSHGFTVNDGFAGFSSFTTDRPYAAELGRAFATPGASHMIMCHPGYPDAELEALDPVVARRGEELAAIMQDPDILDRIAHPRRHPETGRIDWPEAFAHG